MTSKFNKLSLIVIGCLMTWNFNANCQNGVTVAGGNGNGGNANQLYYPSGVFVDGSGNIFVADEVNHRIQKWAPGATSGTTVAGGNGYGSAANQLAHPISVAVDNSGAIYIADQYNQRIQKWLPGSTSGTTVAGGNGGGSAANQLDNPFGVAVDGSGAIYVADRSNHRIQKWAPGATSGTTVAGDPNGVSGSNANQLNNPYGVFVDGSGNIFVADNNNHRIQKWTPGATSGTTVAGGNGAGSAANQLWFPTGVFVDGSGAIYVAEYFNHRIQKWMRGTTSGTTVAGGNGNGSAANQLNGPYGVYVDGSGAIYVADYNNNRIQKWLQSVTCPTPVLTNSGAGCLRDVMTLSNTTGATSIVWNKNGIAVSRPLLQTTYHPGLRGVYSAAVTYSNGCVVTSNLDTLVDYYVPSVAINFNRFQAKVCQGTNITFTARTNSVGTANHYQWRVSGNNAGTDSSGFTYIPSNLDTVSCILTTNARCIVKPTTTSGKSIVTVYNHPCPHGVPSLQNGSYKMDEEASIFSIYPNPATSILNLQIATEGDLRIVNEIGQSVVEQHLSNQQTQINIQHLATGVYFYTFLSEGQTFRGKVVKE